MARVEIVKGDITKIEVDAIVNAADPSLLGGGGVDGAIHAAAGPELLEEFRTLGGCRTGEAKITKGYNLPAEFVVHTVGPIWRGGYYSEAELLEACYLNSLSLAEEKGVKILAFPAISTGVYGYPKKEAAEIAMETVKKYLKNSKIERVVFVLFNDENFGLYKRLLDSRKRI